MSMMDVHEWVHVEYQWYVEVRTCASVEEAGAWLSPETAAGSRHGESPT